MADDVKKTPQPEPYEPGNGFATERECYTRHLRVNGRLTTVEAEMKDLGKSIAAIDRRMIVATGEDGSGGTLGELKKGRLGLKFWMPLVISLVIAGAPGMWFLASVPNRDEVDDMIQKRAPYVHDQPRIMEMVKQHDRDMRSLSLTLSSLTAQIAESNARREGSDRLIEDMIARLRSVERAVARLRR